MCLCVCVCVCVCVFNNKNKISLANVAWAEIDSHLRTTEFTFSMTINALSTLLNNLFIFKRKKYDANN